MINKIKNLALKPFIIIFSLAILLIIINIDIIASYLKLNFITSGDGSAYVTVGQYYAENIFPSAFGWIPNWFAGIPFPQFYPPLFFIITALISKILFFVEYITIFKLSALFLQVLVPGLLAFIVLTHTKNLYATWATGILSVFAISSVNTMDGLYGISLHSTIMAGFVAQLLSFVLFLLWLNYFLKIENSKKDFYLSIFFLAGLSLSNVHIVPIALVYFLTIFIFKTVKYFRPLKVKKIISQFILYFSGGFIPILISAFWYLPLFKNYTFFVTKALEYETGQVLLNTKYLIVIILIALFFAIKNKQKFIIIISTSNLLVILPSLLNLDKIFPDFPLQPGRWLAAFYFLSLIPAGYLSGKLIEYSKNKNIKIFLPISLIVLILFFNYLFNVNKIGLKRWNVATEDILFKEVIDFLKNKEGQVNVENYFQDGEIISFAFNSYIGLSGSSVNTFALRESSISSLFLVPIRNSLSQQPEEFGIKSFRARDKSFLNKDLDLAIDRAAFFGTNNFLIRTPFTEKKFTESKKVYLDKDFGTWKLFSLNEPVKQAEILEYEPILLYSHLNFKNRKPNEYDYSRFQEVAFVENYKDIFFTHPQNPKIDTGNDLENFKITVISDYNYENIDAAYEKLKEYSKENNLILVFSKDPLFQKLLMLDKSHKIIVVPKSLNENEENIQESENNLKKLLEVLEKNKIKKIDITNAKINSVVIDKTNIKIDLENPEKIKLPILIKQSYFPNWQRDDNSNIYLSSPTYMLTFAQDDFELNFEKDISVKVGQIVSLITLLLCLGFLVKELKKKN